MAVARTAVARTAVARTAVARTAIARRGLNHVSQYGDPRVRIRCSKVWAEETFTHLQVYTGETLPEPQRRRGLAVEPMTCPPNAFASGDGLRMLAPGATFAGTWGIATR